jgi:hypothetical protein
MIDTADMDPELARYLNRNYWQQKSENIKATAVTTTPSAPVAQVEPKNTQGGGKVQEVSSSVPECSHKAYQLKFFKLKFNVSGPEFTLVAVKVPFSSILTNSRVRSRFKTKLHGYELI